MMMNEIGSSAKILWMILFSISLASTAYSDEHHSISYNKGGSDIYWGTSNGKISYLVVRTGKIGVDNFRIKNGIPMFGSTSKAFEISKNSLILFSRKEIISGTIDMKSDDFEDWLNSITVESQNSYTPMQSMIVWALKNRLENFGFSLSGKVK